MALDPAVKKYVVHHVSLGTPPKTALKMDNAKMPGFLIQSTNLHKHMGRHLFMALPSGGVWQAGRRARSEEV